MRILTLVLALCICMAAFGQSAIVYDFSKRTIVTPHQGLNDKEKVSIELKNFNPFLYTYSISTKTEKFNNEVPKLLQNSTGGISSLEEILVKFLTTAEQQKLRSGGESGKAYIMLAIFKIDSSFQKFYNKNYVFNDKDHIPKNLLDTLSQAISKYANSDGVNEEALKGYINKYISYQKFNAFFSKDIFNKSIKLNIDDADRLNISFVFKPINTGIDIFDNVLSADSSKLSLPIQRKKGYLTYSTGLFLSGLGNPTYIIQNNNILKEEGSGNAYGLNALAHYMWDIQNNTAFGFNVGLGTPFKKGNVSVVGLAGLTAAFGKKNRFLINTGPTFGMIKSISASNYTDDKKDKLVANLSDVKTYQKLKANWAFTITYNLNK